MERDILDEAAKEGYDGFPFGKDAIGSNLYAWGLNNPITSIDPSGMFGLADMFRAFARALGSFVSNFRTAVRRVSSYVYRAVRAVVGINRAVGAAATRIIKKLAPVLRAVTPIFRMISNRPSFVAQSSQHHVNAIGAGNLKFPSISPIKQGKKEKDLFPISVNVDWNRVAAGGTVALLGGVKLATGELIKDKSIDDMNKKIAKDLEPDWYDKCECDLKNETSNIALGGGAIISGGAWAISGFDVNWDW